MIRHDVHHIHDTMFSASKAAQMTSVRWSCLDSCVYNQYEEDSKTLSWDPLRSSFGSSVRPFLYRCMATKQTSPPEVGWTLHVSSKPSDVVWSRWVREQFLGDLGIGSGQDGWNSSKSSKSLGHQEWKLDISTKNYPVSPIVLGLIGELEQPWFIIDFPIRSHIYRICHVPLLCLNYHKLWWGTPCARKLLSMMVDG